MRRWFSAMMRLLIQDMISVWPYVAAAFTMKTKAASNASATMPAMLRST